MRNEDLDSINIIKQPAILISTWTDKYPQMTERTFAYKPERSNQFDRLLKFVEETTPDEFRQRLETNRNDVWVDLETFAREFLARPWPPEVADRIGHKCVAFSDAASEIKLPHHHSVIRDEVVYMLVRLIGERNRKGLIEPLIRLLKETRIGEERHVVTHVLSRADARCLSRAGAMMDLSKLSPGIRDRFDPARNQYYFYDDPTAFAE